MEKFWSKGVGGRIQSYREISWTIVVSGGNCRIDIQTASPGESLERDVVVQLNRKLCSRYKANRNFPPVYSAFWSSLVIANFCAALTEGRGEGRGGGKRGMAESSWLPAWGARKENTILSRAYTRAYSINGWSDIACPPSKHIFPWTSGRRCPFREEGLFLRPRSNF